MKLSVSHGQQIVKWYNEGKSTHDIAKELNTYPLKILRVLKELNVTMRTKSEATLNMLKHKPHPMQGKKKNK